jgi:hypothetical protein
MAGKTPVKMPDNLPGATKPTINRPPPAKTIPVPKPPYTPTPPAPKRPK